MEVEDMAPWEKTRKIVTSITAENVVSQSATMTIIWMTYERPNGIDNHSITGKRIRRIIKEKYAVKIHVTLYLKCVFWQTRKASIKPCVTLCCAALCKLKRCKESLQERQWLSYLIRETPVLTWNKVSFRRAQLRRNITQNRKQPP